MVNWWLVGFLVVMLLAGLHAVFGWWWLLAIPVAMLWSWLVDK
jgi:hypothetical protein